jgi:predicted acylesterase/phospholipase RssA
VRTLDPERITAASGGALAAACFISEQGACLADAFRKRIEEQDSNVEWKLTTNVRELTPHQQMYRRVVEEVLSDEACERVARGPEFDVLLARPPSYLPELVGAALTMALYEADKKIRSTPHGRYAQAAGARGIRVDARRSAREGRLVDLICIAATIPPVFRMKRWEGQPVIDAGTIDNAPLPRRHRGRTLVLLTRRYRNLPRDPGRTYIAPSQETPADKIDFTDADSLEITYKQGRTDMRQLLVDYGQGQEQASGPGRRTK